MTVPASPALAESNQHLVRDTAVAFAVGVGLTALATRAGRQLTFDGYHYIEFAKQFAAEWPDRFGNHWPFGWPLAGGLVIRLGVPAFYAMVGLSIFSLAGLLSCVARSLSAHPARLPVLVALASAAIIAPQIASSLTELPFAAALAGLALSLAHWPDRRALWSAAAFAVLALCIRYAGLAGLAMSGTHLVLESRRLRDSQRLREAIAALASAGLVSAGLLGLNVLRSGHASGADRGHPPGLGAFPLECISFGWSAPSALVAGGLRDRIGAESPAGLLIGGLCFLAIAGLCAWSWLRPVSRFSRPCAIVALGYSTGMAVLHCIGDFDSLYVARTFLPALAPLAVLSAERWEARPAVLWLGCAVIIAAGVLAAVRGISREIAGDVRRAVPALADRVGPQDRIAINIHAMTISAYFPQRTERFEAQYWQSTSQPRFIVVASESTGRDGGGNNVTADWVALAEKLTSDGRYHYLVREPRLIALERVAGK